MLGSASLLIELWNMLKRLAGRRPVAVFRNCGYLMLCDVMWCYVLPWRSRDYMIILNLNVVWSHVEINEHHNPYHIITIKIHKNPMKFPKTHGLTSSQGKKPVADGSQQRATTSLRSWPADATREDIAKPLGCEIFHRSFMVIPYIWVNYNDLTVLPHWNHS